MNIPFWLDVIFHSTEFPQKFDLFSPFPKMQSRSNPFLSCVNTPTVTIPEKANMANRPLRSSWGRYVVGDVWNGLFWAAL